MRAMARHARAGNAPYANRLVKVRLSPVSPNPASSINHACGSGTGAMADSIQGM